MDIDLSKHLGKIDRRVVLRDHDGKPAQVVIATRRYETDIEDLWDAITNPERIPRWFLPVSGDLRVGGRYQLEGNAGGEIRTCDVPKRLELTWEYGGQTSWVNLKLSPDGDGARLELEHTAHTPEGFWNQYGPGATGVGWDLSLVGLAEHLGDASAFDPAEAEQWPTTEDGKTFVDHSSSAWGEASVAAGTAAEAAQAAAKTTTAFYTGQG